ncbi:unnamed protein product [Linum tenue]|uniref:Uncharacterized protein n=1 Tax=Linum tenue TaxID=586396 RepID=A0AAV0LFT2_9ROSI|nr:unnamed protein product [Linum tenue]
MRQPTEVEEREPGPDLRPEPRRAHCVGQRRRDGGGSWDAE